MTWILDQLPPAYDFRTRYTRQVNAAPTQVWTALHTVTPSTRQEPVDTPQNRQRKENTPENSSWRQEAETAALSIQPVDRG